MNVDVFAVFIAPPTQYVAIVTYAFPKLHHLARTKNRPGVITRIDETRFTYIEEMLKCLEYEGYRRKTKFACGDCRLGRTFSPILRDATHLRKYENEIREIEKSLRARDVLAFEGTRANI